MKNRPSKTQQDLIRKIDILSVCALDACRHSLLRPNDDYYRGQHWGYQLSISLLASDIPGFVSNALDRPAVSRAVALCAFASVPRLCVEKEKEAA